MHRSVNWLTTTPIAHRGLWGGSVQENSISAYQRAVELGYAVEVDVYQTTDGSLVCFHDKNLKRMCGIDKPIFECDLATIKGLRLNGSASLIPTLSELLETVGGKVPLLIELKDQPAKDYVERVVNELKGYKGAFAVQSFNPLYINKVRKLAPHFTRGILGTANASGEKFYVRYIVKNLSLNFLIKPHFISYEYTALPLPKHKKRRLPVLAWTVTSQQDFDKIKDFCDNIIFENFTPKID